MFRFGVLLAKVMTQANKDDATAADRRHARHRTADLGQPPRPAAPGRTARARAAPARALRHPAGRAGDAGAARRDDTGRTGRAREGTAPVDDPGHRRAGRLGPGSPRARSHRPPAGDPLGHQQRPRAGAAGPPAPGGVAGQAAGRADPPGAGGAAGRGADPGKAQPGLTGRRTFRSLATRNYRLFATGQVVSNTGTWMQRVAQDWLVLELTHGSGTALGLAIGLQFLPQLLFSLWGGVIADRYHKRNILLATQAIMGMLALVLGVLALTGVVAVWQVYVLAFALGLVAVVDNPARQTFVAEMVGREGLANAVALNSATFNLARITGPAVAGLVIGAVGVPAAFLVNAASYGAVLAGLKLMRVSELRPVTRAPKAKGQLREALRYVRARPEMWLTLVLVFFVATFGMNFQVTTALMSKGVFHTGASEFGLASTMFALGALGGALAAARRARPSMRLLLVTAFAFGLLEVAAGLMPVFWSFLVMLVPTGLALLMFSTAANSTTQLSTTAAVRGRVMGLYLLVFLGGAPLGSPLVGWAAEQFGARASLVAGGVISAAAAVGVALLLARARGVRIRSYLRPAVLARAEG